MNRHPSETTVLHRDGRCADHGGKVCPKIYAQARRDYDPEPEPVSYGGIAMAVAIILVWFAAIFWAMPVLLTAAAQ